MSKQNVQQNNNLNTWTCSKFNYIVCILLHTSWLCCIIHASHSHHISLFIFTLHFFLVFFYYLFYFFDLIFFFIIPSSYSVLKVVLATHMFASFSVWSVLFLAQLKHFEFPAICLSVNIYKKNRAVVRFSHLGVLIVIDCSLLPLSSFLKP